MIVCVCVFLNRVERCCVHCLLYLFALLINLWKGTHTYERVCTHVPLDCVHERFISAYAWTWEYFLAEKKLCTSLSRINCANNNSASHPQWMCRWIHNMLRYVENDIRSCTESIDTINIPSVISWTQLDYVAYVESGKAIYNHHCSFEHVFVIYFVV